MKARRGLYMHILFLKLFENFVEISRMDITLLYERGNIQSLGCVLLRCGLAFIFSVGVTWFSSVFVRYWQVPQRSDRLAARTLAGVTYLCHAR